MKTRARWLAYLAPFAAMIAVGCGGAPAATHTTTAPAKLLRGPATCVPGAGTGTMGACTPNPSPSEQRQSLRPKASSAPAGLIPDVSEYQGHPNWAAAKDHIVGAIVRIEDASVGSPDRDFYWNMAALTHLHIWHATYWFIRPSGCYQQGLRAAALVKSAVGGLQGPIVGDAEVPLPYACPQQFTEGAERGTGWKLRVLYASRGAYPGGAHAGAVAWDAAYGPSAECIWPGCHLVAWQYTDGVYGPYPHSTPAGSGDISRDYGLTKLTFHHAPSPAERHAAKVRALHIVQHELATAVAARRVYHVLIDRHHCRPGQHAVPSSYHTVCGYWLTKGGEAVAAETTTRKAILKYHREGVK